MRTALVALILVQVLTLPLAQAQDVTIRGVQSCGTWVKERAAKRDIFETAWLLGYLSATAAALRQDFWGRQGVNSLDSESVYLWVDNYCRANPLRSLGDAAVVLFIERCPTDKSCR
jgi:hypothetical protein